MFLLGRTFKWFESSFDLGSPVFELQWVLDPLLLGIDYFVEEVKPEFNLVIGQVFIHLFDLCDYVNCFELGRWLVRVVQQLLELLFLLDDRDAFVLQRRDNILAFLLRSRVLLLLAKFNGLLHLFFIICNLLIAILRRFMNPYQQCINIIKDYLRFCLETSSKPKIISIVTGRSSGACSFFNSWPSLSWAMSALIFSALSIKMAVAFFALSSPTFTLFRLAVDLPRYMQTLMPRSRFRRAWSPCPSSSAESPKVEPTTLSVRDP